MLLDTTGGLKRVRPFFILPDALEADYYVSCHICVKGRLSVNVS